MTPDAFLKDAWRDHGDRPQEVADRLAASLHLVQAPADVPAFAALLAHVHGEHLGQWIEGIAMLDRLRRTPGFDGSPAAEAPLLRWTASLRHASGDAMALEPFSSEDRIIVLANAAAMLAGRQDLRAAIAAYEQALLLAQAGLPTGSPAIRALAIGGNNLAATLEQQADLDAAGVDGMLTAARAALTFWKQAGTWLEEERAEYRLARSLLKAGRAEAAVESARHCVEICRDHEASAFELFFAHVVLAAAQRAAGDPAAFAVAREQALAQLALVPDGEKPWCERGRKELG